MLYRNAIGATIGSARRKTTPAAEDTRRQDGGDSVVSSQRRNLRIPLQLTNPRSKESSSASMTRYPISPGSRTSCHQFAIKSRSLLRADGTYSGNLAHVS